MYLSKWTPVDVPSSTLLEKDALRTEQKAIRSNKTVLEQWKHFQKLDSKQLQFNIKACHEYGQFMVILPKITKIQPMAEDSPRKDDQTAGG